MTVNIIGTTFQDNSAYFSAKSNNSMAYFRYQNGAGLSLNFKGSANKNKIKIENCTFEHNTATSNLGGGLSVLIVDSSKDNDISIENCAFYENSCKYGGGGGANIGYLFDSVTSIPEGNRVSFTDTTFEGNVAHYGGGTLVYSAMAESNKFESNEVIFVNCCWKENAAIYSSAIYLNIFIRGTHNSANYLPKVSFMDCAFKNNQVTEDIYRQKSVGDPPHSFYEHKRGKGCFFSIGYRVTFISSMQFMNNSGSALYLASSVVKIENGSFITFVGNSGHYGGAISLFGTSVLHLHDNITFNFTSNTAIIEGGAIYQEHVDTLEFISLKNCFFYYFLPQRKENCSIIAYFRNNRVADNSQKLAHGNSIFMHSLDSCGSITDFNKMSNNSQSIEYSGPVACFVFENSTGDELSTAGTNFKVNLNITDIFPVVPGNVTDLPIEVNDDFKRKVLKVYQALLRNDENNTNNMSLDPTSAYYNKILLYGMPGDRTNVSFSLSSIGDNEIILPVMLLDCPPGFVSEMSRCVCSAGNFSGISHCDKNSFQAVMKRGFWFGYKNTGTYHRGIYLFSHYCPRSFCNKKESYYLPKTSSVDELDDAVCDKERTGRLCGKCSTNYSAFYHSSDLKCFDDMNCNLGWLLYVISEILPVTVFFLVVIIWDIKFTTGSIQGFIFYSQIFDTLLLSANGQIPLEAATFNLLFALKLFLNVFNLDFFIHDSLSFCLWKNASSLDILAFKYVTIVYAFSLVFFTILVLNYCKLALLENCRKKIRGTKKNISSSVLHGLSGFLVICYSQCTKISLLLLTPATIYSTESASIESVVFFDGNLKYFAGRHLFYAIPALMFVLTIVIFPPILLLVYPLCYKVLSLLRLEESKCTKFLSKVIPLVRLKPFFDSFQSCFKDECRYFSGLYFIYRLTTLVSFASIQNLSLYFLAVEIQFVLMLVVHSWVQPYSTAWHNKLDAFLFTILILVNLITLFRYSHVSKTNVIGLKTVRFLENIQIIIAYLPLLYMAVYIAGKLWIKFGGFCCSCRKQKKEDLSISLSLSLLDRPQD